MNMHQAVNAIPRTRAPAHRHVTPARSGLPLVWVIYVTDRYNYYSKNCCLSWQPPLGLAGIRQKYAWEAVHFNLDSSLEWLQPVVSGTEEFCYDELGGANVAVQTTIHFAWDAPPFHALNQTDFNYISDGEDPDPTRGLSRVNVGNGNGRNVRYTFCSVGFIRPHLYTGCRNEFRQPRWQPFFNHFFFPQSFLCV